MKLPCGHDEKSVSTGDEGTSYCVECEKEARAMDEDLKKALEITVCTYDASHLKGAPLGMFHCPECESMILSGEKHHQIDDTIIAARIVEALQAVRKEENERCAKISESFKFLFDCNCDRNERIAKAIRDSLGGNG